MYIYQRKKDVSLYLSIIIKKKLLTTISNIRYNFIYFHEKYFSSKLFYFCILFFTVDIVYTNENIFRIQSNYALAIDSRRNLHGESP